MKLWQAAQSLTIKKTPCHFRQKETSPVPSYSQESMCPHGDLNCLFMIFKKGTQSGDHSPDNTFDCTVQTNPQNKENYRCTQWCQWASKPLRSIKGTRTGRANSKQTEISGVCAVWFVCLKQLFWFKKKNGQCGDRCSEGGMAKRHSVCFGWKLTNCTIQKHAA